VKRLVKLEHESRQGQEVDRQSRLPRILQAGTNEESSGSHALLEPLRICSKERTNSRVFACAKVHCISTAPLREDAVFTESHDLRGSFGPFSRLTPIALDCSLPTCGSTSWLGNGEYLVIGLFVRLGSKALPTLIRASIKLSA
jgi:hypothetical protein